MCVKIIFISDRKFKKMTKKSLKRYCLLFLLFFLQESNVGAVQKRVALVIGNSSYQYSPLANPVNDAQDMAAILKLLGFDVEVRLDLDRKTMREAIRDFGERLKKTDIGLFYYAGHGVQIKGRNYLIPISADVQSADEVQDESIDAGSILRKMETAGNGVNIVILDACRNNPFARSFRNLEQGLARMEGPVGSFIAYATAPGSVAADGDGRNGLYTHHLLTALKQPGLTIEQTFKRVRNGVIRDTSGRQIPWESSSLIGEFMFSSGENFNSQKNYIAPPDLPTGHLQIIANVPNAQVRVNQVPRGYLDDSGVLNLSHLAANETVVDIQAAGFQPDRKKIKLIPDKWSQLKVTLKPLAEVSQNSYVIDQRHSTSRSKQCLAGKKAVLYILSEFSENEKSSNRRFIVFKFNGLVSAAFKRYDLNFLELDEDKIAQNFNKLLKNFHVTQKFLERFNVEYLVRAFFNVRETPIKVVATQMKTIHVDLDLSIIDLQTGMVLGFGEYGFLGAGLDMVSVVNKNARTVVNGALEKLMVQVCSK